MDVHLRPHLRADWSNAVVPIGPHSAPGAARAAGFFRIVSLS
jgi:hypothetical protein